MLQSSHYRGTPTRSAADRRRHFRWTLVAALLAAGGAFVVVSSMIDRRSQAPGKRSARLPTVESDYRNTAPAAKYVGSGRCIECHPSQHASYLTTSHSRSLGRVNASTAPPDGTFDHPPSNRRYVIDRTEDGLRHREVLRGPAGKSLELHAHTLKYEVGSGDFGHSYLAKVDEFLVQSPITWYSPRKAWGMSPGYDQPVHRSFQRIVSTECLFCHAGLVDMLDNNPFRVRIREHAIGCERCHGPGSLHVHRQTTGSWPGETADKTIVNPSRLPRALAEDVCRQCHLQGDVGVDVRGRQRKDFRPGLPLQYFHVEYRLRERDAGGMTVVGHAEQMHRSLCYQNSETLSCITCHDPHHPVESAQRASAYRTVCLDCHDQQSCGLTLPERVHAAQNDCVHCHMPESPTEVPHVAFTHHRIGVHHENHENGQGQRRDSGLIEGELGILNPEPLQDVSQLPEIDQVRLEGLAYYRLLQKTRDKAAQRIYIRRAIRLLRKVREEGIREPEVDAALATLVASTGNRQEAEQFALSALQSTPSPTDARCEALVLIGQMYFDRRQFDQALPLFRELASSRRNAADWFTLGLCEQNCEYTQRAVEALHKSLEIDPVQVGAHVALAAIYKSRGDTQQAERHERQAAIIERWMPRGP